VVFDLPCYDRASGVGLVPLYGVRCSATSPLRHFKSLGHFYSRSATVFLCQHPACPARHRRFSLDSPPSVLRRCATDLAASAPWAKFEKNASLLCGQRRHNERHP
jgi:hypothetical protein